MNRAGRAAALVSVLWLASGPNAWALATKTYSPGGYWAGARIGYALNSDSEFSDNFRAIAEFEVQQWAPPFVRMTNNTDGWRFPIIGNITNVSAPDTANGNETAFDQLISSSDGLSIAVAPNYMRNFYPFGNRDVAESRYALVGWGTAGYRLNAAKSLSSGAPVYLHQGRASVGVELNLGDFKPSRKPMTIAIEVGGLWFDPSDYESAFGVRRSQETFLDLDVVVPIYQALGLRFERSWPKDARPASWRISVMIADTDKTGQ